MLAGAQAGVPRWCVSHYGSSGRGAGLGIPEMVSVGTIMVAQKLGACRASSFNWSQIVAVQLLFGSKARSNLKKRQLRSVSASRNKLAL